MKITIQLDSVYDEELTEFTELIKARDKNIELSSQLSEIYQKARSELKHGAGTKESLTRTLEEIQDLAAQE